MIVEPGSIPTVRMATAALRSAADDLVKTDQALEFRMIESSRESFALFAGMIRRDSVIRIKDVGFLIKMLAQDLEGKK